MVINEKGLCVAMKDAFKKRSTGYKVAARFDEHGTDQEIVLSAPGWTVIINRENAPRKVMGLIVEHMGDLPQIGRACHVQDEQTQAEIYDMAVPETAELVSGAGIRRTNLTWCGCQIWQRTDNLEVFMVTPKIEDLLDNYNVTLKLTTAGQFYAEGKASKIYFEPMQVMKDRMVALNHLAKLQWV